LLQIIQSKLVESIPLLLFVGFVDLILKFCKLLEDEESFLICDQRVETKKKKERMHCPTLARHKRRED
jgi:hypothetical protein